MQFTTTLLALAAVAPAFAHYNFAALIANGQRTGDYEYVRALGERVSNSPMTDVTSPEMRCNNGSFANAGKTKVMSVKAGDTVGFAIRDSLGHPGPLFTYMSKSTVADVRNYQGDGDWFKIYEAGPKTYANDQGGVMSWTSDGWNNYTFKIPTGIQNGQYLLRGEHLAVHGSGTVGGAQFYLGCAQIEVTGATGGTPSPVVKIPGVYSAQDPGILFNPYWPPVKNYTMPGPRVISGAGGNAVVVPDAGSGSGSGPSSPPPASSSAPVPRPATTSAAASSSAAAPAPTGGSGSGSGSGGSGSTKPLPEGTTLADLLAWLKIILNGATPAKRSEVFGSILM